MIAKGPGSVVCAHCRVSRGKKGCDLCRRTVCATCAADWPTCSEPVGVKLRLGRTARLRAVDAAGRFGLVSRWRGQMQVLDLHALSWIPSPYWVPRYSLLGPEPGGEGLEPQITTDGRVVYGTYVRGDMESAPLTFSGLTADILDHELASARGGARAGRAFAPAVFRARRLRVCSSGRTAWYLGSDEALYVADLERFEISRYQPLPRKVLQAVVVDDERALVAAATWGELALYQIEDDRLRHLDTARVLGDVAWLGLAGPRVAAISSCGFRTASLSVFELGEGGRLERELSVQRSRWLARGPADIRADGRFLAVASRGRGVRLFDLENRRKSTLRGHSDGVDLVAFVGGGAALVTADRKSRVIIRPRADGGYAGATRRVKPGRAAQTGPAEPASRARETS